jgi:hypothetical protein
LHDRSTIATVDLSTFCRPRRTLLDPPDPKPVAPFGLLDPDDWMPSAPEEDAERWDGLS